MVKWSNSYGVGDGNIGELYIVGTGIKGWWWNQCLNVYYPHKTSLMEYSGN